MTQTEEIVNHKRLSLRLIFSSFMWLLQHFRRDECCGERSQSEVTTLSR